MYLDASYYSGCDGKPGPVLITRHSGGSHGSYAVQYGHVMSDLQKNDEIFAGQVIGKVINYKPCCDSQFISQSGMRQQNIHLWNGIWRGTQFCKP